LKRTESRLRFEKKAARKKEKTRTIKRSAKTHLQCLEFVKLEDLNWNCKDFLCIVSRELEGYGHCIRISCLIIILPDDPCTIADHETEASEPAEMPWASKRQTRTETSASS
jgi:hypothetical protein